PHVQHALAGSRTDLLEDPLVDVAGGEAVVGVQTGLERPGVGVERPHGRASRFCRAHSKASFTQPAWSRYWKAPVRPITWSPGQAPRPSWMRRNLASNSRSNTG